MTDIDPVPLEDPLHLELEYFLVRVRQTVHPVGFDMSEKIFRSPESA